VSDVRVAVLDLGGVVVRICRSWQEGCAAAGVDHRPHVERTLVGRETAELLDRHQRGTLPCADFHAGLSRIMQGAYTPDELAAIHRAWTREDYPGVAEVIERVHRAGLESACLSNTNASHWTVLEDSPGVSRIRHRHASHLLGLAKPDPAIYRAFERATGFAPQHIVFFDDLPENVAAARSCGWNAVQVDHTGDTAAQIVAGLAQHGVTV